MLETTRIQPPIEIAAAGDNVLRGTAHGILLVVVRDTDDVLSIVKSPTVLFKEEFVFQFGRSSKGVKTIIEK